MPGGVYIYLSNIKAALAASVSPVIYTLKINILPLIYALINNFSPLHQMQESQQMRLQMESVSLFRFMEKLHSASSDSYLNFHLLSLLPIMSFYSLFKLNIIVALLSTCYLTKESIWLLIK